MENNNHKEEKEEEEEEDVLGPMAGEEEKQEEEREVGSSLTRERVAAAKLFIENHYKAQMKHIQQRKERFLSFSVPLCMCGNYFLCGMLEDLILRFCLHVHLCQSLEPLQSNCITLKVFDLLREKWL